MLNIGILTFHFSDNYGALLQAYALRSWLCSQGHQADFVNYCPSHVEGGGDFQQIWNPCRARTNAKILYLKLSQLRAKIFEPGLIRESLDRFRREELGVRGPVYKTLKDLNGANVQYDLLICGSDQIWNPSSQFGVDPVYFLDFLSDARRRISYAASFGSSDVKLEFQKKIRDKLLRLDGLSVREEASVGFVEKLTGRRPECVPDPTFLLDDYSEILEPADSSKEPHVFAYVLRSGGGFKEIAHCLRNRLQCKVLSAYNPHRRWRDIGETTKGGVVEWLSNLASSKIVLTNSFHATVFSILLNRPFISVRLPGGRAKLSGRLESLLKKTGLSDRMISPGDKAAALRLVDTPIDWGSVNAAVSKLREIGRSYLDVQIKLVG